MTTKLVGKTITSVHLASDRQAIKFDLSDGTESIARCDADCCSHTWIEGLDAPEALLGEVTSIENIPMPDLGSPPDRECIAYYGTKITTTQGTCVIDYRNESNGYYGGNLSWDDDYFYGGVHKQNVSNEEWKKIA